MWLDESHQSHRRTASPDPRSNKGFGGGEQKCLCAERRCVNGSKRRDETTRIKRPPINLRRFFSRFFARFHVLSSAVKSEILFFFFSLFNNPYQLRLYSVHNCTPVTSPRNRTTNILYVHNIIQMYKTRNSVGNSLFKQRSYIYTTL